MDILLEAKIRQCTYDLDMIREKAEAQQKENKKLRETLLFIAIWQIPQVPNSAGRLVPYGCEYGSNGERDYMRNIAQTALTTVEEII